jgi:hypothetical protein
MTRYLLLMPLLLAACEGLPKDVEGTSAGVDARGYMRVGLVSDEGIEGEVEKTRELLARLGPARVERAPTEPLLSRLEAGELDLVLVTVDDKSPWKTRVTFGPRLASEDIGGRPHSLRPAMMNGENAWIGRVYRAATAIGGKP